MKRYLALIAATALAGSALAADFELAGMKSPLPESWKEEEPSNKMRQAQFRLPKAEGDKEDAELALFKFPGGSGTVDANLARQTAKFQPAEGEKEVKSKVEKIKVGAVEATYQDVAGTYKKKAFPMAKDFTAVPGYRQLYVVFTTDKGEFYLTLLGPEKTVEKHKKEFEGWLKNFK